MRRPSAKTPHTGLGAPRWRTTGHLPRRRQPILPPAAGDRVGVRRDGATRPSQSCHDDDDDVVMTTERVGFFASVVDRRRRPLITVHTDATSVANRLSRLGAESPRTAVSNV